MMKLMIILPILLLITSCASVGSSSGVGVAQQFQLIEIDGESYFLDNRSGNIYKITKKPDGTLDSSKKAGRVGL